MRPLSFAIVFRRCSFAFLLLLCVAPVGAQERLRLAGFLQVPGRPMSSYYVYMTITAGRISGYTITDWTGGNRLKASLTGGRGPVSEMFIQETASLDERKMPGMRYCYFSARLKLTIARGRQRWSGPFDSREADGTLCDRGIMTLLDDAPDLDAPAPPKPKPAPKPVPPPPAPKPKPKPAPAAVPRPKRDTAKSKPVVVAPPKRDTLKPRPVPLVSPWRDTMKPKPVVVITPLPQAPARPDSCLRRFDWSSPTLDLDVFDGWVVDGDVISLSVSGRTLLDHATLSSTKQHFSIPLAPGWNTLYVTLHKDGFDPPVTPNLTLTDGATAHPIEVSGSEGQVARICIFRK